MQHEKKNRQKEAMKSAKYLVSKFPMYAKLWLGKKSEHPEVRLRDKNDGRSKTEL